MPAAVLAVLSSMPAVVAFLTAHRLGLTWSGRTFTAPGDMSVYLSYILQVSDGSWLFDNRFAAEAGMPVLNLIWLSAGLVARYFGLSPVTAFQALRVALIPVLAWTVYWSADYFLNRRSEKAWAVFLALFSSGWGVTALFLDNPEMVNGHYNWPIDLWVSEAIIFLSAMHSPHFIAGWILIILSMTLLARSYIESRPGLAVLAGLSSLILFQFHPFHAPTLYAVALMAFIVLSAVGGSARNKFMSLAAYGFTSLPSVFYHWWLLQPGRNEATALSANFNYTPSFYYVLVGFGALVPLSLVGAVSWRRRAEGNRPIRLRFLFIVCWVAVQSLIIYAPILFQRRFIQGLQFPLVLLSAVGIVALSGQDWWRKRWSRWLHPVVAVVLLGIVLIPSSFYALANNLGLLVNNNPPIFYHTADEMRAMEWLRDNADASDLVLSSFPSGNSLPGRSGVRVYVGHWVATPEAELRDEMSQRFFGSDTDDRWRQDFLRENGVTMVYVGPVERQLGAYLVGKDYLQPVFEGGSVTVYRVR